MVRWNKKRRVCHGGTLYGGGGDRGVCLRAAEAERSGATIEKYAPRAAAVRRLAGRARGDKRNRDRVEGRAGAALCPGQRELYAGGAQRVFYLLRLGRVPCQTAARPARRLYRDAGREMSRAEYARLVAAAQASGTSAWRWYCKPCAAWGCGSVSCEFLTVRAARQGRARSATKANAACCFCRGHSARGCLPIAGRRGIGEGPVFVTRSGRPLDRSNIWRMMKALCQAAKVAPQKVFPHNLRHLFARCFYKQQKDIEHLACILGTATSTRPASTPTPAARSTAGRWKSWRCCYSHAIRIEFQAAPP